MIVDQLINGIVLGSVYALMAIGYTMVWNVLRFINFAHGEVYMGGAFVALYLALLDMPLWLAYVGGVVAGALLGYLMEKVVYKHMRTAPKLNLLIAAIGIAILLQNVAQFVFGASPERLHSPFLTESVLIGGVLINQHYVFIIIIAIIVMALLEIFINRTLMGKAVQAAAQNIHATELMGINANKVISITFAVGSAVGAIAGILVGPIFLVYPTMGVFAGLKGFTASVMGGMGNIPGALVAGLMLGIVESFATGFISSGYRDAVAMVILLVILLVRPQGIFGKIVQEKV
ncbi:branched-chain amino acid ABC transporter permease [Pseudogracilibacillus auburnensis]|uniref:Amino acid/amide ABC transporter membrane protein 1 (HAAT family) n=1 Tax=Pseudogracilibacillus auburnensis TaxID=1494959 RepID=A0A2V3W203_9BACI|nr:branched-chain amino acid ABC transporter permease [Pseudogracilibacillus auburnensis]MBO1004418.1 branched-chain amino acid ABC transporter permease [Pseudogracilibacillus auburnensis]PXW87128.1 amino acid/amide ABC transporter membrane protein 1 (HAAT family) [Pseudogracilibacillus auburnensis]